MNFSNISSAINIDETLYMKIGSSWLLDSLHIFSLPIVGLAGFILNILSLITMLKINIKDTKLYDYLKVYTLVGCLLCLVCSTTFISYSARYFDNFRYSFSRLHRCILLPIILSSLYFITNVLDILIEIDRLSIFIDKLKVFTKPSAYLVSIIVIFVCVSINLPSAWFYYILSSEQYLEELKNNVDTFGYCSFSNFFFSYGLIISYTQVAIRDLLTLIVLIIINILVIYYFNQYSSKSKIFVSQHAGELKNTNQSKNRLQMTSKKEKKSKQLLLMTILLGVSSIISHFMVILTIIFSMSNSLFSAFYYSYYIGILFLNLKSLSNFFIFYYFNSNFKNNSIIKL
jgi:hypothetical protein